MKKNTEIKIDAKKMSNKICENLNWDEKSYRWWNERIYMNDWNLENFKILKENLILEDCMNHTQTHTHTHRSSTRKTWVSFSRYLFVCASHNDLEKEKKL